MYLEYRDMNIIPVNDEVVVLTKPDGQGWKLKKEEVIEFSYKGLPFGNKTNLSIGLMRNDILMFGQRQSLKVTSCHLIVPEDGLYHLCILSCDDEE